VHLQHAVRGRAPASPACVPRCPGPPPIGVPRVRPPSPRRARPTRPRLARSPTACIASRIASTARERPAAKSRRSARDRRRPRLRLRAPRGPGPAKSERPRPTSGPEPIRLRRRASGPPGAARRARRAGSRCAPSTGRGSAPRASRGARSRPPRRATSRSSAPPSGAARLDQPPVRLAQRVLHRPVADQPPVEEHVLRLGRRARDRRRPTSPQMSTPRASSNRSTPTSSICPSSSRPAPRGALAGRLVGRAGPASPSRRHDLEPDPGVRQREVRSHSTHRVFSVCRCAQELAPRRRVEEQRAHGDGRPHGPAPGGPGRSPRPPSISHAESSSAVRERIDSRETRRDRRERLAAEPERRDAVQVLGSAILLVACGSSASGRCSPDPAPVVGTRTSSIPPALELHTDAATRRRRSRSRPVP
jgi:hypothetical protein